jgi:hypothetical protein
MKRIEYIKYSASPSFGWREMDGKAICGGGHMVEFYMVVVELKNGGLGPGRVLTLLASSRSL